MRCTRERQLEVLAVSDRQRRRVVSVGAVPGVLARREGRWVVENDSEVRLLEGLRGERGARDRLWALAAVLDEGVVGAGGLRRLNTRVSAILAVERPEEVWRVRVPGGLMAAVAYVCVCVSEEMLSRWLGFALAARLGVNLVRGLLPGPGWVSWYVPHGRRWVTLDRDEHWISELPGSFWSRLAAHSDERLRAVAVASDPVSRPRVLESLIDEHLGDLEVLDLVASHSRTPTRALRRMAQRSWGGERPDLRVAQNRSATAGLLSELAESHDWELRYVAAAHPKMPVSALRRLARDESPRVRAAVARAVSASTAVLEALVSDRDVWVRRNVASNPSTPRAVLEVLLGDRLAAVRAAAAENENTPAEKVAARARDRAIKVRCEVAARGVGTEVLALLAADPKWAVRVAVACNVQTPLEALDLLARDACEEVRAGVAYNTSAPSGALRALVGDEFTWTRVHVAYILAIELNPAGQNPGPVGLSAVLNAIKVAPRIKEVVADRAYTVKRRISCVRCTSAESTSSWTTPRTWLTDPTTRLSAGAANPLSFIAARRCQLGPQKTT